MTKRNQIYKCEVCGNIVEMVGEGNGTLVCCGQPMNLIVENTIDAAKEKHIPVATVGKSKITVNVGAVDHPMEEGHFIEWIELLFEGRTGRQYLKPGDKPGTEFNVAPKAFTVRAYCNLHGLWKS